MKAEELRDKLNLLQETLDGLRCPEATLAQLETKLGQVYVIVFPPDGSPGLVAQVITMNKRLDLLERTQEDQKKADKDFHRSVVIAVIAALASVGAALVAVLGG